MAEQLNAIVNYLHADANDRTERRHSDERSALRTRLIKATRICDGSSASAVRDWVQDVEIASKYFGAATRDRETLQVVFSTLQGPARRCYERFMEEQPDRSNVTWAAVKQHLRRAYLTQDEEEFLRSKLEKVRQTAYESNSAYARSFQEIADQAYPADTRNLAVQKIILNLYLKGLRNRDLVRRLVQEAEPDSLQEAINATELFSAQEERVQRLWKRDPLVTTDDQMEVGEVNRRTTNEDKDDLTKQVNTLVRKVSGLQTEFNKFKGERSSTTNGQRTSSTRSPSTGSRPPARRTTERTTEYRKLICYECKQPGHIARNCEVQKQRLASSEVAAIEENQEN